MPPRALTDISVISDVGLQCGGDYPKGPPHIEEENAMTASFILEASRSDGSTYRLEFSLSGFLLDLASGLIGL